MVPGATAAHTRSPFTFWNRAALLPRPNAREKRGANTDYAGAGFEPVLASRGSALRVVGESAEQPSSGRCEHRGAQPQCG